MKDFDTRVYNISDFVEWRETDLLDLSPDFQRRSVWTEKAKSYLVDTVIRGKPIPKLLLTQQFDKRRNIRIVVDGQQRLRALLDYHDGNFRISRAHNKEFAGRTFEELPDEIKNDFLKYEIGVDLLYDMPYRDILDIFARINTYTVKLNKQESRNAKFLGYFKQTSYSLGYDYVDYWIDSGVLSKTNVSRMAEAELASDLLVALVGGIQTNKNIDTYYTRYEDEPGPVEEKLEIFDQVMSYIGEIYPNADMKGTNWKRIHLFYSLFTAIAHFLGGIENIEVKRISIRPTNIGKMRVTLDEVSARYDEYTHSNYSGETPDDFAEFIDKSRRATTDTGSRKFRTEFICKKIADSLA